MITLVAVMLLIVFGCIVIAMAVTPMMAEGDRHRPAPERPPVPLPQADRSPAVDHRQAA